MIRRPLLYVCAPWSTRTTAEADETDRAIKKALDLGWFPIFGPYALERALDDRKPEERSRAFECDRGLLEHCEALLVVGDRVTDGMKHDLAYYEDLCGEAGLVYKWPELPEPEPDEPRSVPTEKEIKKVVSRFMVRERIVGAAEKLVHELTDVTYKMPSAAGEALEDLRKAVSK